MKFIEIRTGMCVRKEDIFSVEYLDEYSCSIQTDKDTYVVNYPYITFLQLLEVDNEQDKQTKLLNSINNIMKTQGSFAG